MKIEGKNYLRMHRTQIAEPACLPSCAVVYVKFIYFFRFKKLKVFSASDDALQFSTANGLDSEKIIIEQNITWLHA